VAIPAYKTYEPVRNNSRPDYVSFLNISKTKNATSITGVVKRLSLSELAELDRRERNYLRIEVTDCVDFICSDRERPPKPFAVWTYTASKASSKRYEKSAGKSVISQGYYDDFQAATIQVQARIQDQSKLNFDFNDQITLMALNKKQIAD
jgi:hypothetical protein